MDEWLNQCIDELVIQVNVLTKALIPFAEKEECDTGFIVGYDSDHTENCIECQQIIAARAALEAA